MTTLSEKIVAAEDALVTKKDALAELMAQEYDPATDEEVEVKANELADQIEEGEKHLAMLRRSESALKSQVKANADSKGDRNPYVSMQNNRQKGHNLIGVVISKMKAHADRINPVAAAEQYFKDDPEIGMILKADADPGMMSDAAWAGKLVREATSEFLDLLRDQSVVTQLPLIRLQFDRYGSISVPFNSSTRGSMAGSFVGEGAAIPVGSSSYSEKILTPKKMGRLSVLSKDIMMHSVPAIEPIVRNQILADTAEALDTAFLDDVARSAVRPAGLQDPTDGAGAANIVGSLGPTVANVTADLKGVLSRAMAARVGNSGVWVMNPLRRLGLMTVQDAASGEYPFRDEVNRGTLYGYPIVVSQNVDPALVSFIPSDTIAFANDYAPRIDVSDSATLHMEDSSALPLNDGTTAAAPVRSLFQTDTLAVRMTLGMDWLVIRPNGCQVLTGVAW